MLRGELFAEYWITNPDAATKVFAKLNGWSESIANVPEDFRQCWGLLITVWHSGSIGLLDATRVQSLLYNGKCSSRHYENGAWNEWGDT